MSCHKIMFVLLTAGTICLSRREYLYSQRFSVIIISFFSHKRIVYFLRNYNTYNIMQIVLARKVSTVRQMQTLMFQSIFYNL